ncbi:MAG: septation protein A [Gammaproteobacteria bacterium]|nr:septation protein A [Gammaproteobacteria bacterium]
MKLLFDFFPIFLFFVTYKFYGVYAATGVAMAASFIQLAVDRIKNKRFETMYLVTFFSILMLGSATLFLHNEIFIKWKPTILNWLFGVIFIGSSIIGKKPLIQRTLEKKIQLPPLVWQRLNISWAIFFLLIGAANLFVVYHYSTNTWVNFKLFGMFGLMLVFAIAQGLYLSKYIEVTTEQK